jgi:hypothetical protein
MAQMILETSFVYMHLLKHKKSPLPFIKYTSCILSVQKNIRGD